MSAIATAWAWRQIQNGRVRNIAARLVLLKLADRSDDKGLCWPGHEKTAGDCDLSEKGARKAMSELEEGSLVFVERRKDKSGRDLSNRYYLPIEREEERSTPRREPSSKRKELASPESNTVTRSSSLLPEHQEAVRSIATFDGLIIEFVLDKFKSQLVQALFYGGVTDVFCAQDMLDELADAIELGQRGERLKIGSPVAWLRKLIKRQSVGKFDRVGCLRIQARRESQLIAQKHICQQTPVAVDKNRQRISEVVQHQRQRQSLLSNP